MFLEILKCKKVYVCPSTPCVLLYVYRGDACFVDSALVTCVLVQTGVCEVVHTQIGDRNTLGYSVTIYVDHHTYLMMALCGRNMSWTKW
jgi:hypothetical protein